MKVEILTGEEAANFLTEQNSLRNYGDVRLGTVANLAAEFGGGLGTIAVRIDDGRPIAAYVRHIGQTTIIGGRLDGQRKIIVQKRLLWQNERDFKLELDPDTPCLVEQ